MSPLLLISNPSGNIFRSLWRSLKKNFGIFDKQIIDKQKQKYF